MRNLRRRKKSGEDRLVEKARKKLSGMSGIDQSKVAEMSQQAINGIKAGTFDRNAAKAYGLSDEDFDSLRASKKSTGDLAKEYGLAYDDMGNGRWHASGHPKALKSERMNSGVEISGDEKGAQVTKWNRGGDMLPKEHYSSAEEAMKAAKDYLSEGYKNSSVDYIRKSNTGQYVVGYSGDERARKLGLADTERFFDTREEAEAFLKSRNNPRTPKLVAGTPVDATNSGSNKKFSASSSAERINAISKSHNNGGGEKEDWKNVRAELDNAPAGTVMIQTGNRGVKFQYEKQADGNWKNTDTGYVQDSKTVSMGWTGSGSRPQVEFTTSKNALTNEQVKASQDAAVSGRLNQALGLDRNGRKIGNRSTPKVDSSAPRTTSRNAKYDTSRATTKSSNLNSMSVSELRAMAKEYGVSQKTISMYDADELRMLLTGLLHKK